jgi:hypothetical protein
MMIANPVHVLERLTLVAPLGVTFHDTVTGLRVGSGLDVAIYQKTIPTSRAQMFPNPSGVYVATSAPGLSREFAFGAGDDEFWSSLPAPQLYVMEVSDNERRFQPFSLEIDLPQRGIFNWVSPLETSPPASDKPASIPLYSAPARRSPPGMAVVRADLRDATRDAPAAWAIVEARYEGNLIARGMTDERGSLALIFPYPAPATFAASSPSESPPTIHSPKLYEQKWDVEISAGYAGVAEGATVPLIPDLRATLEQLSLPPARLWKDHVGGAELKSIELHYGRESVLKTEDAASSSPPAQPSALLVTPAGSPP